MIKNLIAAATCSLMLTYYAAAADAQSTPILIIESYHNTYPWDASYIEGIKEGMTGDFEFHVFEMNTKRLPKSEYEKSSEAAWAYYLKVKPALVFLGDDNALKYLGPKFTEVDTPVVFLGINNNPRFYNVVGKKNITGVLERPLLKRSIVEMKKILNLNRILVLFDSGTTSRVTFEEVFDGKERNRAGGIDIDMKRIGSYETWQATVGSAGKKGYDAIVIGLYHTLTNREGTHVSAGEVLKWTSENTPVPPFAFWDFTVGKDKAIGGLTLFGKTQGQAAARVGMKVLHGTSPARIKMKAGETGRLFFSRTQLEKYRIRLPPEMEAAAEFVD